MTLLKDPTSITNGRPTGNNYYYPAGGTALQYSGSALTVPMAPLSYGTPNNNPTDNPPTPGDNDAATTTFQSSRYDLAGITPENFDRTNLQRDSELATTPVTSAPELWWNPLVYSLADVSRANADPVLFEKHSRTFHRYGNPPLRIIPTQGVPGYTGIPGTRQPSTTDPGLWYTRPQCNPTVQAPVTAATLAEMAPYFLQHCSQFIVEYAGDYLQQDNDPTNAHTAT